MFSATWAALGSAGAWAGDVIYSAYVGIGQIGTAIGMGLQAVGGKIGL